MVAIKSAQSQESRATLSRGSLKIDNRVTDPFRMQMSHLGGSLFDDVDAATLGERVDSIVALVVGRGAHQV